MAENAFCEVSSEVEYPRACANMYSLSDIDSSKLLLGCYMKHE